MSKSSTGKVSIFPVVTIFVVSSSNIFEGKKRVFSDNRFFCINANSSFESFGIRELEKSHNPINGVKAYRWLAKLVVAAAVLIGVEVGIGVLVGVGVLVGIEVGAGDAVGYGV